MPDPRLKDCIEELRPILAKYDVAGVVMLASKTHLEFLYELSPSWSCLTQESTPKGRMLRFKATGETHPNVEDKRLVQDLTLGMLAGLNDLAGKAAHDLENAMTMTGINFTCCRTREEI